MLQGEELIGARAWRVLFGVVSLPLAVTAVAYFINHRYEGVQLWDIKVTLSYIAASISRLFFQV